MSIGSKLPRSDAHHVNSWTDELLPGTFFHSCYSFDGSEKFRTFILLQIWGLTAGKLQKRAILKHYFQ